MKRLGAVLLATICILSIRGVTQQTQAQGAANINVTGIPTLIRAPFTNQIEQNFRNGRYQVIFTYNSTNVNPVRFRFRVQLLQGGKELFEITSDPKSFRPGAYVFTSFFYELPFPQTFKQVLNQAERKLRKQILQEGTIPEGNYQLRIQAIPEEGSGMIASAPSLTPFTVRFPQPPRLINPTDESLLTLESPVFNWTPVVGIQGSPIEYDFLLVQVFPHQTPLQALNSNRAIGEKTLINQNTLIYTPEFLPLEDGKSYAWQISAHLPNLPLPLKNNGESEFNTFVYKEGAQSGLIRGVQQLRNIPLVPDFAGLTGLDELEITEETNAFILNGNATLALNFAGSATQRIPVEVHNLQIQKGSISPPVVMSGSVEGKTNQPILIPGNTNGHITLNRIGWQFGEGVKATASITDINGQDYKTKGTLALDANGARGRIRVSGTPLFKYEKELVTVTITELEASFPEGTIVGHGNVSLLGRDTDCKASRFALMHNKLSTILSCDSPFSIPLVEDSDRLSMNVKRVKGVVDIDLTTNAIDYNLEAHTSVGLQTTKDQLCGTDALVTFDSEEGIAVEPGQQRCPVAEPKIDLGFITVEPTQTELRTLSYNSTLEKWDFDLNLSTKLHVPGFNEWESVELNDITIDKQGIHFNRFAFENTLEDMPAYTINEYGIELESFILNKFTFPLFDWDKIGPGPWDLSFSGNVSVPRVGNYPSCVRGLNLDLTNGHVADMQVLGEINVNNFSGCTYNFGADYGINISDLSGEFGVKYDQNGGSELIGQLYFSGSLVMGRPFSCETDGNISTPNSTFSFTTGLSGTVEDVVPGCDIAIGPFNGRVTESDLLFSYDPSTGNKAVMEAAAELELAEGNAITGSFNLDLITGTFTDVNFTIDRPFTWGIPQDDPVLKFNISQAQLNETGFLVDGEEQLLLGSGTTMTTTFDNFLINLETRNIEQGRIIFGGDFGVMAGINAENELDFEVVETGTQLDKDPGLYMGLDGPIIIDQDGLHSEGGSTATVSYNEKTYDNLVTVDLTEDFAFQLFPFKVGSGRVNFLVDGSRFAYAEPDGFHPDPGFFGDMILPDNLPLPTSDIAYLKLRENEELLVEAHQNSNGNYELSTKAGKTLTLVAPVLGKENPPVLSNVTLNNVVISSDPTNPEILQGSIEVNVPANDPSLQLTDRQVPLTLQKLYFGSRTVNGNSLTALYLLGELHMFDQDLPNAQQKAAFFVKSDGSIRANLDITGMAAQVPLLSGNQAVLRFDGISGTFNLSEGAMNPSYNFLIESGFDVNTAAGFATGADFDLRLQSTGMSIENFVPKEFNDDSEIDFGVLGLKLNSVESIPEFNYSPAAGFDFAVALDVDLRIQSAGGGEIAFPLQGLEIHDTGINMPVQNIDAGSIPGLNLPTFSLAGFEFKPLTLETESDFHFSWTQGASFNPDLAMSFKMHLPEFEDTDLNPPDGLTFTGVSLQNGYFVGSVQPFSPLGGAEIPLVPGLPDSPTLNIIEISGSLNYNTAEGQLVNINLDGNLGDVPSFHADDPNACTPDNTAFSLSLVQGKYFEGSITGVQPCGYLQLGPARISVTSGDLNFSVSSGEQHAELSGGVQVQLRAPDGGSPITATGNDITLNLIKGEITEGSISINRSFALNLPFGSQDPLLNFTVDQAQLDRDGFTIDGTGNLASDGVEANVQFDSLKVGFESYSIIGGSADIASGFGMQIGVSPLSLELKNPAAPLSIENGIDMDLSGGLELNQNGLTLSGSATTSLLYNGEEYASMRADLLNGFTLNIDGFGVHAGRAEFYDISDAQDDLIAVLSQSGFNPISGLISVLPSRIPLPTEDIAFIDIKDDNNNLLIDTTANTANEGFTLSTREGEALTVVIPALPDGSGPPTEVDVEFSLVTDGAYNVTGGTLTLSSPTSLESSLDLPVRLTELTLGDNGNGVELTAGIKFELPGMLSGEQNSSDNDLTAQVVIGSNGLESGEIELGTYETAYNSTLSPVFSYEQSGSISGSTTSDIFEASLMGVRATFGTGKSIALSGTLSSSLIIDEQAGDDPIFFTASYSSTGWDFNIDAGAIGELTMGDATLKNINGIDLHSTDDAFYVELNGTVSMEGIVDEPLGVTVQGLEVGVNDYDADPTLHFAIGSAGGALADQTFNLFGGALSGVIENPSITLNGRSIGITSASGSLKFLDKNIGYTNLVLDTSGEFSVDEIQSQSITLIENYLTLKSLSISNTNGLRLDSELGVTLPDPIGESSTATLSIYRDEQDQVQFESTAPAFDLNEDFAIGNFGHFTLTQVKADIDPMDWTNSGIYANGKLYRAGNEQDAIITLGDDAAITTTPGIALTSSGVQFDVTGSADFTFDFSMFEITINAHNISATQDGFELTLSGSADVSLPQMSADIGYSGFKINETGVVDEGNLDGNGEIAIEDIGTITIGQFVHETYANGKAIEIANTSAASPTELSGEEATTSKNVSELLCFGPCPVSSSLENSSQKPALQITINAGSDSGSGGFSGAVESVFYYKTTAGEEAIFVDGLNVDLSDNFNMNASFNYAKDASGGMLLRAAASGEFTYGSQSVGALVAGKFSTIGNETSYGLFVAAEASSGVPIVPGVVSITGIGGGFFYNPVQEDIAAVTTALESFQYKPVDPAGIDIDPATNFAVLLYAGVGIYGAQGKNVLEGKTSMLITGNSFYLDARGTVLGMDGNGIGNALLEGKMSLNITEPPNSPNTTFISGSIGVDLDVPSVLDGDGGIEYFAKKTGSTTLWGIMGHVEFNVLSVLSGDGDFLAANKGVMLTLGLGFDVDVPIITVKSDVEASIWLLDDSYELPFGAYATFRAEACMGLCITAEAKAALASRGGPNYTMFAAVKGCIDFVGCISAHASITDGDIDASLGKGSQGGLIAQARSQKEDFEQEIQEMKNQIDAVKTALESPPDFPGFGISSQDVVEAGINFYAQSKYWRQQAVNSIQNSIEVNNTSGGPAYSMPSQFQPLINNVMLAERSYKDHVEYIMNPADEKFVLVNEIASTKDLSDQVSGLLSQGIETVIEGRESAAKLYDQMLSTMSKSPVSNVDSPDDFDISPNVTRSPSFDVDQTLAAKQADSTAALQAQVESLDQQFREDIATVDSTLMEMHGLLNSQTNSETDDVIPSINTLAHQYAYVISLMDKYLAYAANKRWLEWNWANNVLSTLNQQNNQIQNGIQQLNTNFSTAFSNQRTHNSTSTNNDLTAHYVNAAYRAVQRSHAITRFKDSTFTSSIPGPYSSTAPAPVKNAYSMLRNPQDHSSQSITDKVEDINNKFWYQMHAQGLRRYAYFVSQRVHNEVTPIRQQLRGSLVEAHKTMTQTIDKFYANKAALTSILYNMVDNYLQWRQSIAATTDGSTTLNSSSAAYSQRLQELSQALVPPQITSITANPNRSSNSNFEQFFNTTEITWNATHPVGVVENSIDVKEYVENTDVSVGLGDYLSIGNNNSIIIYPYKSSHPRGGASQQAIEFSNSKPLNVGVRVRGYAGNTAVRRASFNVAVGPGGQTVSPGSSVIPSSQNETPPETPQLLFHTTYGMSTTTQYQINSSPLGAGSARVASVNKYWTNEPSVIKFTIRAHDSETGISTYKYAVGSSKGATDIVSWTELQGIREELPQVPASQMTGQTPVINMSPGKEYYLSIQVINGAGKPSQIVETDAPVIYDNEQPSKPIVQYTAMPLMTAMTVFGYTPPVDPVLETVPELDFGEDEMITWEDGETPNIKAQWGKSSDEGSGIEYYAYVFTPDEEVPMDYFDGNPAFTTEETEAIYPGSTTNLDYDTEMYLYVRAKDYAGNTSEILKLGPLKAKDKTPPHSGVMHAKINPSDVKLYFTELPYDPESGLKGIQYAIGSSPGTTNTRDWPGGDTVDFSWTSEENSELLWSGISHTDVEPYVSISRSDLPEGGTFYISYRTVNEQGKTSSLRTTGPITLDESIPLMPSVELTYYSSDSELKIELEDLEDPDSGIKSVEYSIRYPNSYTTLIGWEDVENYGNNRFGKFDLSKTVDFNEDQIDDFLDLTVRIRITNGAGLQRTFLRSVSYTDLNSVNIQPATVQYPQYHINF